MNIFYKLSLRHRITLIIVFTSLFILTIGLSIGLYSEITKIKERSLSEKTLTAKIVSSYTVTDLTFNNKNSALESLSYLNKDKSILNAHLYDKSGRLFVSLYEKSINYDHDINKNNIGRWHKIDGEELHILEPIIFDNKKIGSLYLHASIKESLNEIESRIKFLIVMLIMLTVVAFMIAGKLSEIISMPLVSLTNAVKNYSPHDIKKLNIETKRKDETGLLINAFNEMIIRIEDNEILRDVAEKKLTESKTDLRLILDNLVDGIITMDENSNILTFSKTAEVMFGYDENEVKGKNIKLLMPDLIANKHDQYLKDYIDTGEANIIGVAREVKVQHKNKNIFPIRLTVTELPRDLNGIRRFVGSCQNLTLIKQHENQIRRTQKMDALGKLTGGIAHDYNNMLGVVMGYSELLEEALKENPKLKKYASEIHHAGERGAKLTRKLLTFSRQKQPEASLLSFNALLLEEKDMLEKTLTVSIRLVLDLSDDLWLVFLDSGDMEDVILNVCINAMHAMNGNGQLSIHTKNEHISSPEAQLLNIMTGDYVTLSIIDTGCGMDEATKEKIFDPFYTTKGDKGTGLGLSQVYGFVNQNNGAIKVYSELDQGSHFKLYFPRYISDDIKYIPEKTKQTQSVIVNRNESILVVDDEESLRNLAYEILSAQGYHVVCAENASKALQILETDYFDLMLTDIIMPEMNGYQLSAIVKENYPELNILLTSGFTGNPHEDIIDENLLNNLLHKPYNSSSLLQKIHDMLK